MSMKIYLTSFPRSLSPSPLSCLQFSVCHLDRLLLLFLPTMSTDNHNCHHNDHQTTGRPNGYSKEVDFREIHCMERNRWMNKRDTLRASAMKLDTYSHEQNLFLSPFCHYIHYISSCFRFIILFLPCVFPCVEEDPSQFCTMFTWLLVVFLASHLSAQLWVALLQWCHRCLVGSSLGRWTFHCQWAVNSR